MIGRCRDHGDARRGSYTIQWDAISSGRLGFIRSLILSVRLDLAPEQDRLWLQAMTVSSSARINCTTQTLSEWEENAGIVHRRDPNRSFQAAGLTELE